MIIKINHPYSDTPYEALSIPEDPKLGNLPFDANLKTIKGRFPVLNKWWASHPTVSPKRTQAELAKAVDQMGFPGRVLIDAFLCTTLDKANDFDELVKQQDNLPLKLHAPQMGTWESDLSAWQAHPAMREITAIDIPIVHQHHYDDVKIDLFEVRFDS